MLGSLCERFYCCKLSCLQIILTDPKILHTADSRSYDIAYLPFAVWIGLIQTVK